MADLPSVTDGRALARRDCSEVVGPLLLTRGGPDGHMLWAARLGLGSGSEVLGLDDEVSRTTTGDRA